MLLVVSVFAAAVDDVFAVECVVIKTAVESVVDVDGGEFEASHGVEPGENQIVAAADKADLEAAGTHPRGRGEDRIRPAERERRPRASRTSIGGVSKGVPVRPPAGASRTSQKLSDL
ncbi:hypothetical protein NDI85_16985 [Halomicroarcula sp. S1AR25-4]|uniref:hypothetical protein n=1 Tax=Haloarcula sp. S1AR25-4 TaxID=2950538 RepID=UPI0028755C1E|nr:hypothetical protein [Halomicroarcula sp. S1AR25-4]MDS0279490.1 hypothetical protein [Halomicroarcula sp. S1AR25-4]